MCIILLVPRSGPGIRRDVYYCSHFIEEEIQAKRI